MKAEKGASSTVPTGHFDQACSRNVGRGQFETFWDILGHFGTIRKTF